MIYGDLHTHTFYSSDVDPEKGGNVEANCRKAVERGLGVLAVTDHYDIDGVVDGYFTAPDVDSIYKEVMAAKEKYRGRLNVLFGIELGQPLRMQRQAAELLKKYPFEYVIGSVHAVEGIIDFFSVEYDDYGDRELKALFYRYLDELERTARECDFDTLAHITYPLRYYKKSGRDTMLQITKKGREYFEQTFKTLISHGKSLEVNTSGLRQNLKTTMPHDDLLLFYKELGGTMITVGSDSHYPKYIGSDIAATCDHLKDLGFETVTYYSGRKPYFEKL